MFKRAKPVEFRTRSPDRAAETARRRRDAIIAAVEAQRHAAQLELDGLTRRSRAAMTQAAFALDGADDWGRRSPSEESNIVALERIATSTFDAAASLKLELKSLDALLTQLRNGALGHA